MALFTKTYALLAVGTTGLSLLLSVPASAPAAAADTCTVPSDTTAISWTGDANSTSWTDPANWSGNQVPDPNSDGTYTSNFVCIGGSAKVTLSASMQYIAGFALSGSAQLNIASTGSLSVGTASAEDSATSTVGSGTTLTVDGGTLAGNGDVSVAGTLALKGELIKHVAHPGTQSGAGITQVTSSGVVKIDGSSWGQTELSDGRSIDNSGKIVFLDDGFLEMDNATSLTDEKGSTLSMDGNGGIYPTTPAPSDTSPSILQEGAVTESGTGKSVIGVATKFSGGKVKVTKGTLLINSNTLPKAPVSRNSGYGIATCDVSSNHICHDMETDKAVPQAALVTTSTQAPKTTTVTVKLKSKNPKKVGGHSLIGKQIAVTASNAKTTHSTKMTLTFNPGLKGVKKGLKPHVYRNGHRVTYCSQHVLTALNPQCVVWAKTLGSKPAGSKGDLQLLVISIKPKATWAVTR